MESSSEVLFSPREITSETFKLYLSQIFARFGIPKTLVSDNGPEFVIGDLKQWCESLGIKEMESPVYRQRRGAKLQMNSCWDAE